MRLPDPKTLVDSIGDGALEVLKIVPTFAEKEARVSAQYAADIKGDIDRVQSALPDDPSALVGTVVSVLGHTAKAAISAIGAAFESADETFEGIKKQVSRVL